MWTHPSEVSKNSILANEIFTSLGAKEWPEISARVYTGGRSSLAALAPAVARASLQGDGTATRILQTAGQELAGLANRLLKRLGKPYPVALVGGMRLLSPVLLQGFEAGLEQATSFRVITDEPVTAAVRLAFKR